MHGFGDSGFGESGFDGGVGQTSGSAIQEALGRISEQEQHRDTHSARRAEPEPLDFNSESCPACGSTFMPDAIYCRKCGKKRSDGLFDVGRSTRGDYRPAQSDDLVNGYPVRRGFSFNLTDTPDGIGPVYGHGRYIDGPAGPAPKWNPLDGIKRNWTSGWAEANRPAVSRGDGPMPGRPYENQARPNGSPQPGTVAHELMRSENRQEALRTKINHIEADLAKPPGMEGFVRIVVPFLLRERWGNPGDRGHLGVEMQGCRVCEIVDPKAYEFGWTPGDTVVKVNGYPVQTPRDFQRELARAEDACRATGRPIIFDIWRQPMWGPPLRPGTPPMRDSMMSGGAPPLMGGPPPRLGTPPRMMDPLMDPLMVGSTPMMSGVPPPPMMGGPLPPTSGRYGTPPPGYGTPPVGGYVHHRHSHHSHHHGRDQDSDRDRERHSHHSHHHGRDQDSDRRDRDRDRDRHGPNNSPGSRGPSPARPSPGMTYSPFFEPVLHGMPGTPEPVLLPPPVIGPPLPPVVQHFVAVPVPPPQDPRQVQSTIRDLSARVNERRGARPDRSHSGERHGASPHRGHSGERQGPSPPRSHSGESGRRPPPPPYPSVAYGAPPQSLPGSSGSRSSMPGPPPGSFVSRGSSSFDKQPPYPSISYGGKPGSFPGGTGSYSSMPGPLPPGPLPPTNMAGSWTSAPYPRPPRSREPSLYDSRVVA